MSMMLFHAYMITSLQPSSKRFHSPRTAWWWRLAFAAPGAVQLHFTFDAFESTRAGGRPAESRVGAGFISHRLCGEHRSGPRYRRDAAGRGHPAAEPIPGPAHRRTRG